MIRSVRFVDAMEVIPRLAAYINLEGQFMKPDQLAKKIFNDRNKSIIIQQSLESYHLNDEDISNSLGFLKGKHQQKIF